jgi:hypothetical protein
VTKQLRDWIDEMVAAGKKSVPLAKLREKLDEVERKPSRGRRNGKINPADLVGNAEAARILGVDRTRISKWRNKDVLTTFGPKKLPFPEPVATLDAGPVWDRNDVLTILPFVEERRRARAK